MKKNIFVALAAAVVLLFTSCNKELELAGTSWKSNHIDQTFSYQGITANLTMDLTVTFTSATNYTLVYTGNVNAASIINIPLNDTEMGTYVFDGENGVLTDSEGKAHSFTYNKEAKTLNATYDYEGINFSVTFTQQ